MNNKIMKKILKILAISLLLFSNVNAEERSNKLDKLFIELKNSKNLSSAFAIEKEIQKIWLIHPSCLLYTSDAADE